MKQKITITFECEHSNIEYKSSFSAKDITTQDELFQLWLLEGAWHAIGFEAVVELLKGVDD